MSIVCTTKVPVLLIPYSCSKVECTGVYLIFMFISNSVSKNLIGDEGIGILLDGLTNNNETKLEKLG